MSNSSSTAAWTAGFMSACRAADLSRMQSCLQSQQVEARYVNRMFTLYCGKRWRDAIPLFLLYGQMPAEVIADGFRQACASHDVAILNILLSHGGCDVNTPDSLGATPLMHAMCNSVDRIERYRLESCRLLIDAGADVTAKDDQGRSVMWYAHLKKVSDEVLGLLCATERYIRRKDLLETLVNASHTYLGTDNEIRIPYGPIGEKAAEESTADATPSVLATIFRNTQMLGHDGHRYVAEYGGMTAMFL